MVIDIDREFDSVRQYESNSAEDSEVVLSVEGVSKKFCRDLKRSLFYGVRDIASDISGLRTKNDKLRKKEFWALDNVSFQLKKGEALGLVGKNGSGKSTLLRIIAGLIKPDMGTVKVRGRVAPLIALGAGFNPILTGRENIYANMAILGLSKEEINERFDDVVEFAEIGDAIDAPVQSYSSGMAARLGFASAIHTEPDIILIDEVLAVGDVKFRAKCHRKLHELLNKGKSFILVSHMSHAILNVCQSAVYLLKGNLIAAGEPSFIMSRYERDLFTNANCQHNISSGIMRVKEKPEAESLGVDITALFFRSDKGDILDFIESGKPTYFCVECKANKEFPDINIFLIVREIAGENDLILHLSSFFDENSLSVKPGKQELRVFMPYLGLKSGSYTMKINLKTGGLYMLDVVESFRFSVKSEEKINRGIFYQPRTWEVVK